MGIQHSKPQDTLLGSFCPIIFYWAPGWVSYINQSHKKKLLATQRSVLIRVTKAYSTTSTYALQVLEQLTDHFCIRRQKNFLIREVEFPHEYYDDGEMDKYFPDVRIRSRMNWIQLSDHPTRWHLRLRCSGVGNRPSPGKRLTTPHRGKSSTEHGSSKSRLRLASSPDLQGPTYNLSPLSSVCQTFSRQEGTSRSGMLETSQIMTFLQKKFKYLYIVINSNCNLLFK